MAHATPSLENYAVFGFFQNNLFTPPALLWGGLFIGLCLQGFFHLGPVGDGGDSAFSGNCDGGCLGAHSQNFGNGQADRKSVV